VLKRPSSRRRTHAAEIQLNLVPMLDALVTMIVFLMYTMAFLSLTMIESPLPIVSSEQNQRQLKDRPLQLTLTLNDKDVLLWSPFDQIKQETIPNHEDGTVDVLKLHESLIAIKQKFPTEEKIILVPQKTTSYDTIVKILDASKPYEKTDPVIVVKNEKTGVQEQSKSLFGEVVFGNLLGDD
jgi:biopolymer transport protein ExbD